MRNIKLIFERFTENMVKARALPILFTVQNVSLSLLVLVYANVVISNGKVNGELDYEQIKLFYNLVVYILFFLVFLYAPYFLAGSLNSLVTNKTIEYLLSAKMKIKEITYATFLRGLFTVIVLLVSAFPIACISLFFGGVGVIRVIRIVVCLLCFALLLSSICIYISSFFKEKNVSILASYVISFFILLFHIFFFKYILNIGLITFFYATFVILVSIGFIMLAYNGRVFND